MAETTDTTRAPDPHPYAFADIQAARKALQAHMLAADKSGFENLKAVAATIGAFSYALTESSDVGDQRITDAWYYLSRQLEAAERALETWNKRAWLLTLIVAGNDLDALAKHPLHRDEAPPSRPPEG